MRSRKATRQAREALDRRLSMLSSASRFAVPQRGWIRAIRDALGMSAADLGARMGISGASVRSLEDKEVSGGVRLSSLQRAAAAMDCTLVYAFVPNESLESTVQRQAASLLNQQMTRLEQTMALEAQEATPGARSLDEQLQAIIDSGKLWKDPVAREE